MGKGTKGGDDAVSLGGRLLRIAQDGVIELEAFGEFLVLLCGITTGGEVGDIEGFDGGAAFTKRLALFRSPSGERLGEPGHNHGLLALEVR